ncbi:hypothetical protein HZA97_00915 [Candidatus Woesearchaeota archaeon]|nr:hypothetical protein [Candidatus Woesearchaeota archaeon]
MPCSYCKGKHESEQCPLWHKQLALTKIKTREIKESYFGTAPAPFIGHHGYPEVNVGILSPGIVSAEPFDDPKLWASQKFSIPQIIELRTQLINSRSKLNIKQTDKHLAIAQEVSLASKPVDVEINLKKVPSFNVRLDSYTAPTGPAAELMSARITSNPKIHTKVDKIINDEVKSVYAINHLYENGFDENYLSKILSTGTLGIDKKLVPTRWSITAVDDTISKNVINEMKEYAVADYQAYFGDYMGNYYLIMFFSDFWSYELFECSLETKGTSIDFEGFNGRSEYAYNCTGGYYTVRLGIAEKLKQMKRQASVLAIRFITNEYTLPLGVWVTREATRKTLQNKPIRFASKELMLEYAKLLIKKKFGYDITNYFKENWFLKNVEKQKRLFDF